MGLCIPADWKQLITLQVVLLARGFCWRIPENRWCEIPHGAVQKGWEICPVWSTRWKSDSFFSFPPAILLHWTPARNICDSLSLWALWDCAPTSVLICFFKDADKHVCPRLLQGVKSQQIHKPTCPWIRSWGGVFSHSYHHHHQPYNLWRTDEHVFPTSLMWVGCRKNS